MLTSLDPNRFEKVEDYLNALCNQLEQLVMARISDCRSGATMYYVVEDNASRVVLGLRPWVERLVEKFKPKPVSAEHFFAGIPAPCDIIGSLDYASMLLSRGPKFLW